MLDRSDAEGLGRDDPGGVFPEQIKAAVEAGTGAEVRADRSAQHRVVLRRAGRTHRSSSPPRADSGWHGPVGEVLEGVLLGQEVGEDEITTLFSARGAEVAAVAQVADELRRAVVGDVVTYVRNRNINYTNVCTFKCRFCGFSKGPLSLNLRGTPYLLTLEDIQGACVEAVDRRRHRGLPAGRDPPRLRRRLLHRRGPGRARGGARTSTSTGSPPWRSPRGPSGWTSRWPTTCAG